jgi:hypothetical protein
LWSEVVDIGGFAATPPLTTLLYKPVPLKSREVSTNSVISEIECLSKLVYCATGTPQESDDLASCASKKT